MLKTAEVISTEGKYAVVKSERSAMCDGCHKSSCGSSCAMGAIMGTDKSVTVTALNRAEACVGDTVELETADSKVLLYALVVFILPIAVSMIFYGVTERIFHSEWLSVLMAAVGFILTFIGVGFVEKCKRGKDCDIVITRIIKKHEDNE